MQLQLYGKKIWFYRQPIDFRCAIDGLVGLISSELKQKPKEPAEHYEAWPTL